MIKIREGYKGKPIELSGDTVEILNGKGETLFRMIKKGDDIEISTGITCESVNGEILDDAILIAPRSSNSVTIGRPIYGSVG